MIGTNNVSGLTSIVPAKTCITLGLHYIPSIYTVNQPCQFSLIALSLHVQKILC